MFREPHRLLQHSDARTPRSGRQLVPDTRAFGEGDGLGHLGLRACPCCDRPPPALPDRRQGWRQELEAARRDLSRLNGMFGPANVLQGVRPLSLSGKFRELVIIPEVKKERPRYERNPVYDPDECLI